LSETPKIRKLDVMNSFKISHQEVDDADLKKGNRLNNRQI
jgi:hypothetical protein